jgi:gamma-glutamyl-gamma-aminobutyrate hydrolase PuuD
VPLFAICRGIQVLEVALGGTLVQDIAGEVPYRSAAVSGGGPGSCWALGTDNA